MTLSDVIIGQVVTSSVKLHEEAPARQNAVGGSNRHKSSEKCFQDCAWT